MPEDLWKDANIFLPDDCEPVIGYSDCHQIIVVRYYGNYWFSVETDAMVYILYWQECPECPDALALE